MVGVECDFKSVTSGFEFQLCTHYLHDLRAFCFFISKMKCVQLETTRPVFLKCGPWTTYIRIVRVPLLKVQTGMGSGSLYF